MTLLISFFGKSKPIHFLILTGLILIYWSLVTFLYWDISGEAFSYFSTSVGLLLVFLLSVGLLNFICKRNSLTKNNSFALLLFIIFPLCFPIIFKSANMICAVFFILLALRRIFSLKSGIDIKKKIFDASLWISVATLFEASSLFFLPLLFVAIFLFAAADFRNWIIPIMGVLTVFVLHLVFHLVMKDTFSGLFSNFNPPNFDFENYRKIQILVPLSILLAFSLWALGDYIFTYRKTKGSYKKMMLLVMVCFISGVFASLFSDIKNTAEMLFIAIPVAIFGAGYFQRKKDMLFKEILLIILIILGLIIPFI